MKEAKRLTAAALCLLLCTGCANIPEPDPAEELETMPTAGSLAPETTETPTEPTAASVSPASASETDAADETAEDETIETEEPTEPTAPWRIAYQTLLRAKYKTSSHIDSYFALIRLDEDDVPELVVLDDTRMELYCYDGSNASLLLEDGYKTSAIAGQNVCYQPEMSLFSTAFSTMGGGTGFTIFEYEQLDTLHVNRYYFNNNENVDGELPYNHIWDQAEKFEVTDNGYRDVTLGDSWVHIGEDFDALEKLTESAAEQVGADWKTKQDEVEEQDE